MVINQRTIPMAQGENQRDNNRRKVGENLKLSSHLNDQTVRSILKEHTRNLAIRGLNNFHNNHKN